uniref:Uncharacterized protein n=1 Tax=Panagrolaimus davidi TaxID=227884 RepID=A0A914Q1E2_9BILA
MKIIRRLKKRISLFMFSKSSKTTLQPRSLNPGTLVPELLFDIGNKFVEDGESDALIKFALSGKLQFQAVVKVFDSITTLKLCETCFFIGGNDNPCCKFGLKTDNPQSPILVQLIGNSIKNLQLNCNISDGKCQMYQSFIDVIVAKKQLTSFSADVCCSRTFLAEFLPHFSSTLKNLVVPSKLMSAAFCDSFDLDSLTVLNTMELNFSMLCKTLSLKLSYIQLDDPIIQRYEHPVSHNEQINPHLSSVKEFTIDDIYICYHIDRFETTITDFPSLKSLNYNIAMKNGIFSIGILRNHISRFTTIINQSKNVPSKITCFFYNSSKMDKFVVFVVFC